MANGLSWNREAFFVSTDKSLLQVSRIHSFLATKAYWCLDIPKDVVESSISNSLCFGLFDGSKAEVPQIGYARLVTDSATFAWLCDVYVEENYRGRGLSKWLMCCIMEHPQLKSLRRICLATKDAHDLYRQYGFKVTESPQNWMEIKDNNLYKKMRLAQAEK